MATQSVSLAHETQAETLVMDVPVCDACAARVLTVRDFEAVAAFPLRPDVPATPR